MDKYRSLLKQFVSYFFVGGIAAIVEWVMFAILSSCFLLDYLFATVLAFLFSTTVNWILGRTWTFKDSTYKDKRVKELALVFVVSLIGLLFNILLMYLFVTVLSLDTVLLKILSKIMATGIVFAWNFLGRRYLVYRNIRIR